MLLYDDVWIVLQILIFPISMVYDHFQPLLTLRVRGEDPCILPLVKPFLKPLKMLTLYSTSILIR